MYHVLLRNKDEGFLLHLLGVLCMFFDDIESCVILSDKKPNGKFNLLFVYGQFDLYSPNEISAAIRIIRYYDKHLIEL